MKRSRRHVYSVLLAASLLVLPASAETLDSLAEFGNSATSDATSGAGIPRGADFSNAASGAYTLTAGGTDLWGNSDNGSFIWDSTTSRAAGENFSVIVRSVSVAAEPSELLADQWGRTGPMARKTPDAANSANAAHIRKSVGTTILQGRPSDGAGTDRGPNNNGEVPNGAENGDVRTTPIWLGLHRVNGEWYSTWAVDDAGSPGPWSTSIQRAGTADLAGEVWVGLAHQSHNITPAVNTAVFDNFQVSAFDADLGDFPLIGSAEVTFNGNDVSLTASASELGEGPSVDANWEVRYLSATETVPLAGSLRADIYMVTNAGNLAAFDAIVAGGAPAGTAFIEQIDWNANAYTRTNAAGANLFAAAVPGSFLGDQNDYGVNLVGEIHIPSDADRDGLEAILFHDGVDDFCYLEIDGVPVIAGDNDWSSVAGDGNGGGFQGLLDVSDPKFDDGEWVSFRMVTWEGGGGDDAILVWDALDRTGADTVTGGADALTSSYLGTGLAIGNKIPFLHNGSDKIPKENFRRFVPASVYDESGLGQPNNQLLGSALIPGVNAVEVSINGSVVLTEPVLPTLESGDFTSADVVTFTLLDVGDGGTSDIDTASVMMTIDGAMVTPDSVVKVGTVTTIIYTFPSPPVPHTFYNFGLMGNTTVATGSIGFDFSTVIRSWPILEELRAGLTDPPNAMVGWDYMEFDAVATLGRNLGGDPDNFIDAQTVIRDAAMPLAQAEVPFVNFYDPDSNPGGGGDWRPDTPILSDDVGVGDDQYVTFARTIVTIAPGDEGDYTFRISGDDGYGLRVTGIAGVPDGTFTAIAGNGTNRLDSRDRSIAYFPAGTGDSNAFAVCNLSVTGDYLIEFFAFEGGGGSFQEISWAKGAFSDLNQTDTFVLLGNPSSFVGESRWGTIPESVLPPLPGNGESGWSTYIWYGATGGSLGETMDYFRVPADPGLATATFLPQLNHRDDAQGESGRFTPDEIYPGDPPGDTNDIKMLARATIIAPVDGDYTIQVRSDDGFLLRWVDPANVFHSKDGPGVLHGSAPNEVFFPAGTGDSNTRAAVFLTAGAHELHFAWWEGGGGSFFEISSAPGVELNENGPYELLSAMPTLTNLYVGKPPAPAFRITDIVYDPVADQFTLTWLSEPGATYGLFFDTDLGEFDSDYDDGIESGGETTTFGPFDNPRPGAPRIFFRVQKN